MGLPHKSELRGGVPAFDGIFRGRGIGGSNLCIERRTVGGRCDLRRPAGGEQCQASQQQAGKPHSRRAGIPVSAVLIFFSHD